MFYSTLYQSPVGEYTLVSDGEKLVAMSLAGQKYYEKEVPKDSIEKSDLAIFKTTKNWLNRYFAGEKTQISELLLSPVGNEFRQSVWKILCEIPHGEITTYGEIAQKIATKMRKEKMSAQAIGGVVGHNPISIIIPCHRVVGANGNLTGYAGGLKIKIKLLELEGNDMSRFFCA